MRGIRDGSLLINTNVDVNTFLQSDLLAQASANTQARPNAKPDPDLKVRTALDRAAARIAGKFERQPDVEAAIRDTMGQTYLDLGLFPAARTQLERALELERQVLGVQNPKTLKTVYRLGAWIRPSSPPPATPLTCGQTGSQTRSLSESTWINETPH